MLFDILRVNNVFLKDRNFQSLQRNLIHRCLHKKVAI